MCGRKGTANGPFLRFEAKAGPQPLFGRGCVGYSLASSSGGFLCRWARMLNRCLSGTQLVARAVASVDVFARSKSGNLVRSAVLMNWKWPIFRVSSLSRRCPFAISASSVS
jgi:hypothetical protein